MRDFSQKQSPSDVVAALRPGVKAISTAVLVEAIYSAFISGCFGALVQKMRKARPLWASALLIVAVLPPSCYGLTTLIPRYLRNITESPSPGYVQMVPSVTGKDEKQRTFCIQEGQT